VLTAGDVLTLAAAECWKLREAHALLLAKGYGSRMEAASGYGAVLARAAGARTARSI